MDASTPALVRSRFSTWLMVAVLGLATLALYWPTLHHGFVDFDDDVYVTANPHVQMGLTWENLKWSTVNPVCANWHPLTMLSHMLDCQLFGLKPAGHHLISILLHAFNTVLVFLFLRGVTGAFWRSALVAALFGWHPLHVESVAWVAERKDVLSGCFGLLTLIFYCRYAAVQSRIESLAPAVEPAQAHEVRSARLNYGLALFWFALGLMSKPMLVTWPFVLLLLDYWPLARFEPFTHNPPFRSIWRLCREKIPFFTLTALSCVVTYAVQRQTGAVMTVESLPWTARIENALISYCRYLEKLFWPTDLAVFYPYPKYWPLAEVVLAGAVILGVTLLLFRYRRRYPFMLPGWLWFVGTLVPVIGLVQVGEQSMADRYSYLPSIGLFILVIWGVYELTRHNRYQTAAVSIAGSAVLVLCLVLTRQQLGYWQDGETLFQRAVDVTRNNSVAYNHLGAALDAKGRVDEAILQLNEAIRVDPSYADAHYNLGTAFEQKREVNQAIDQYQQAIRLNPDYAEAYNNLGFALGQSGQPDQAIRQFEQAIRLKPDYAQAHNNLGNAFLNQGRLDEAVPQFQQAIHLDPNYVQAHNNLGAALGRKGQLDEAIVEFQKAIRLDPNFADARNNLNRALEMQNAPRGH